MRHLPSRLAIACGLTAATIHLACEPAPMPPPWNTTEVIDASARDTQVASKDVASIVDAATGASDVDARSDVGAADGRGPDTTVPVEPEAGDVEPGPEDAGAGCRPYDAGPMVPDGFEDPDAATVQDVERLFQRSCAMGYCHGRPSEGFWVPFGDAGSLHQILVNRPSTRAPGMPLVAPGDPGRSFLVQKMYGDGLCALASECAYGACGSPMSLGQEELDLVVSWIRHGARP